MSAAGFSIGIINDAELLAQAVLDGDSAAASAKADAVKRQIAEMREEITAHEGTIECARSNYANDEVEVDDVPLLSVAEDGVWVSAWVWVPIEQDDPNDCAECARSNGPHFTGECTHG